MTSAISISHLNKTYASGFQALKDINLDIRHGEIFALLGPNGAGKTTLISIICGLVNPSAGTVKFDIDPHRKHALLNGLDDVGLTMQKQNKIASFEAKAKASRPWV